MSVEKTIACPICGEEAKTRFGGGEDKTYVNCSITGQFEITGTALAMLGAMSAEQKKVHLLNHYIWRGQRPDSILVIDSETLKRVLESQSLPSPEEQAANLVRFLGDTLAELDPGRELQLNPKRAAAIIGASSTSGAAWIARELEALGYVRRESKALGIFAAGLTLRGWDEYGRLRRAHSEGPIAFMAMPFNDMELDDVFANCFKPAVGQAGFELRRIDEKPPAGLIDDRMRVEVRKSRFVVAELTHENRGVYWEAGFAEALGKPVIFTCRKAYFDDYPSHFDVSHHHTILWEPDKLAKAAENLKATVRATLPEEARMAD
jgi:hypothetical protein